MGKGVGRVAALLVGLVLTAALLVPARPSRADQVALDDPLARSADRLMLGGQNAQGAPRRGALSRNMALVGQVQTTNPAATPGFAADHPARLGPGGTTVGFNGDVWVHRAASGRTYAYVGSWGRRRLSNATFFCPGSAIKIVDISDPASPVQVAEAAVHASSTSEDVEVRRVTIAGGRTIDLLATGLQRCQNEGLAGADFWDVSDPTSPVHLGFYDVSSRRPGEPVCRDANGNPAVRGVHEIHIFQKGGRVYALLPAIFREATIAGVASEENCGPEFIVVDITDPTSPAFVDDWGVNQDLGLDPTQGLLDGKPNQGDFARQFAHSVNTSADRSKAFVSYWDFGAAIFDISGLSGDPATPTTGFDLQANLLGTTPFAAGDEGNTHSAEPAVIGGRPLLLTGDEDCIGPPSGFLRIFDISSPTAPRQIGTFQTPHSQGGIPSQVGDVCIHIPVVKGSKAAISWYADGVRVVDISDPTAPAEEGHFVPPPNVDPFGVFVTNSWVWGATFANIGGQEYVVASDINFGLYVLRQVP